MSMMYKVQLPLTTERNPWSGLDTTIYPLFQDIDKYKQWCKERVGANGWNYYGMYHKNPCVFKFKRAEDLVAFKLVHGL